MAQQTAVEWLVEKMLNQDWYTYKSLEYIEQAKAMEKEQIMDAYWNGTIDIDKKDALIEAENFYKETYNK
jgi:hypothetical protein